HQNLIAQPGISCPIEFRLIQGARDETHVPTATQSHSTPSPSSVPRWLTICLQWLLFQQIHYHVSVIRVIPFRGIMGILFLLLSPEIVRPMSSLSKFSFVISDIRFPPGSGRRGRTPSLTCQPTTRVSCL